MALRDIFRRPPKRQKPLGRTGTVNTSGFLEERDVNAKWRWPESIRTADEMRRTSESIRFILGLIKTPIRAATWTVDPASDDNEDLERAAFAEHALFDELDGGWDDFLRRALNYLDFGFAVFERIGEHREVRFSYEPEDGEPVEIRREMVVPRLGERLQRTIQEWHPEEDDRSKLDHIVQWFGDQVAPTMVEIPASQLVVFTNDQEGDDWRGTSLLRAAYQSYDYKLKLENLEAIAYERSMGVPVIYPPKDADDDQLDAVEEGLKGLWQRHGAYGVMPGPRADDIEDGNQGWRFEVVSIPGDAGRSATEQIQRHEAAMTRNVLAEFMRLGHEQSGSRAVGEVQQDVYYQGVEAHSRYVEDIVTEQVIRPLIQWNYGTDAEIPRLRASNIQARNVEVLAKAGSQLIQHGAIIPNLETENAFRDVLDLPQREAEGDEDEVRRQRAINPMPMLPGNEPSDEDGEGEPPERATPFAERKPFVPWRELRPEERFVAFAEIDRKLDRAQDAFVSVVEAAARQPVENAQREAERAISPEQVTQVEVDPQPIARAIEQQLGLVHDEGRRQVRAELRRQRAGITFEEIPFDRQRTFLAQALMAAQAIATAATRAVRSFRLRVLAEPQADPPTGPGFEPFASIRLEGGKAALGLTSEAFNAGRTAEMSESLTEIATVVYSAILDSGTCAPCRAADGTEALPPAGDPPCPNPACFGGGACRCLWVPVIREIGPSDG